MRYPPGEEQGRARSLQVGGTPRNRIHMHEISDMVKRHYDHDQSAEQINRLDPSVRSS